MVIANKPLNYQAIILEEAETEIRLLVQSEYIKGTPITIISKKVSEIIYRATSKIKIPNLKEAGRLSLLNFYRRQYQELSRLPRNKLLVAAFLIGYSSGKRTPTSTQKQALKTEGMTVINSTVNYPKAKLYGVPLQKFSKDYFNDNVKPVYERLSKQYPLDPQDESGRNSLRNLAEMEVRYNAHLNQIEEFKQKGVNLVIASTHADCSDRCAKWQGRVYSLDGTYGTTDDGRKYIPLEIATDVYYTTKAGKRYKNGLLGFNCRHYFVEYKSGYRFPKPNAEDERKEYAITEEQRRLERQVRYWRTRAVTAKTVGGQEYSLARQKAIKWNKEYIKYSKDNGRAYYPSRTKIL